jgi:NAD+ synthase (glutamine-hydrolysing)
MEMGYPKEAIEDTFRRIKNMEYKRRQAAPSIKITSKAFGIGRKMPIVNKYLEKIVDKNKNNFTRVKKSK